MRWVSTLGFKITSSKIKFKGECWRNKFDFFNEVYMRWVSTLGFKSTSSKIKFKGECWRNKFDFFNEVYMRWVSTLAFKSTSSRCEVNACESLKILCNKNKGKYEPINFQHFDYICLII